MDIERVTGGKRIRLVEETGNQLRALLCKADPWSRMDCRRPQCTACSGEEGDLGRCRDRNLVYQNVCLECKKEGRVTRYLGETNRSLWEKNGEHQQDALNPTKNSHIREHVLINHPHLLPNMLDIFSISVIKPTRSALQRQIREAVEIARDRSYLLLNNKEEFNRCLVPTIRMEGPAHPKKQAELELAMEQNIIRLTKDQEEEALAQAKNTHTKKRDLGKQTREEETKRIRLDRHLGEDGGGGEAGVERGGGVGGGEAETSRQNIATQQTDIRQYTYRLMNKASEEEEDDEHEKNRSNDDSDDDKKFDDDDTQSETRCKEVMEDADQSEYELSRYDVSSSLTVSIVRPEQTNTPTIISEQITNKTKLSSDINTFRPPTRTRVKKFARRRSKVTHNGANSADIRNFFSPVTGALENRVKFVDISSLPGG